MMHWEIEYSLRQNRYLKKRFLKGFLVAFSLTYGVLLVLMFLQRHNLQTQGFMGSGVGILFWIASGFFWLTTFFLWLSSMTTYRAHYDLDTKQVRVRVKALKARKKWLELLDFINASTYKNQPGNVSVHSLGSQGSFKIAWRNVRDITWLDKDQTILIKGRPGEKMPVYYHAAQADELKAFITDLQGKKRIKTST